MPVRMYGELYTHKICAVDFFLISPIVINFIRCPSISPAKVGFHDSAVDIDFNQMSLDQSESTILYERIIL